MKAIFSHINDIVDQDFFVEHILIVDLNETIGVLLLFIMILLIPKSPREEKGHICM